MVMLDDDIMRQLRATFRVEAEEHVQAMNHALLALERGARGEERIELLEEIFREAHSLKGASGAADISDVEAIGHRLESVFGAAKEEQIELTADLCDILYEGIDVVSAIVDAAIEERPHGVDLASLFASLDAAERGEVIPLPASTTIAEEPAEPAPSSARAEPEPETPLVDEAETKTSPSRDTSRRSSASSRSLGEETIRVSTNKLDALMTQAGELLVAGLKIDQRLKEVEEVNHAVEDWNREWLKVRAVYSHLIHDEAKEQMRPLIRFLQLNQQSLKTLSGTVADLRRGFSSDALHLSRVTSDLQEDVMRVRMLPVLTVFDAFPRLVRDLARERAKEVQLVVQGAETELDRKVLEEIKDPLMHLLRNAVDHGIESPDVRQSSGKPPQGTITLTAFQKGNNIVIEIADDGGGINVDRVKKAALKAGLITSEDAATISDDEAMRLIFSSGLSTSATVTSTSGRGVGMDVVRRNVEALHGQVELDSTLGEGTTILLTLPLTMATTQELLVQVHDQIYGIPISAVERILRLNIDEISNVEGQEAILVDNDPVSLIHLCDVLEMPRREEEIRVGQKLPVIILNVAKSRIAFHVDGVVGQQESVVKSLGRQLSRVRNVAGATILGTGQVIMILNPIDLIKTARLVAGRPVVTLRASEAAAAKEERHTVLVVDDSLTTRNLEQNILEVAGYQVKLAMDGLEALDILRGDSCRLVVSDILMPRMDGFTLTREIKQDPGLRDTPVVLVTSLESETDKARGLEVGADAYIVKSTFDQENLLQTIEQLI